MLRAIATERIATGGEIILVDDGSTDGSAEILSRCEGAIIISQPNRGVAAATNAGIARASCLYLRLVDGDDIILPGSTQKLIDALTETECRFAFGRYAREPENRPVAPVRIIDDPGATMLLKQPFIPSATLGLTETMQACLPLPEDIRTAQDFSLGLRLAALTKFAALDDIVCLLPPVATGLSSNKGRMFADTAILAARFAIEQDWSQRLRRLALGRNAGRARNYLRRHNPRRKRVFAMVSAMAILARLPFRWPFSAWMAYIAHAYDP